MEHKVSIIVPVYGVEKYIKECVGSLLTQSYPRLEILLVDDGGEDRSPQICDLFASMDNRIKVIHKPNGGAASARNAGLDAATGEYICFVDGDDRIAPDYVSHLLHAAKENEADICVCGFYKLTKAGAEAVDPAENGSYTGTEYLLRFLSDWSCSLLWNKIFRRDVIGNIRMEEGRKVDDEFFTYLVVMNSCKVVVTDTPLYYYRMRGSSVMQDMGPYLERIMLDRIAYVTARYRNIAQKLPEIEPEFFLDALDTMSRYWYHSKDMPKAQRQIRSWAKAHTGRILRLNISLKRKLGYLHHFYVKKPAVMSERNSIQMNADEYFD